MPQSEGGVVYVSAGSGLFVPFESLYSVSVLRHRATVMLAKDVGKMLEVVEIASCGDVLNASVGGFQ